MGCDDPFGSKPAKSNGANTQLTPALKKLMDAPGLASEWYNYRLDGVQTDFFRPKLLGSSIIEGENVGLNLKQASCISCHAVSSVKDDGEDGINTLAALPTSPVGFPSPLPSMDWILRDFVWSLGLACPELSWHDRLAAGLRSCALKAVLRVAAREESGRTGPERDALAAGTGWPDRRPGFIAGKAAHAALVAARMGPGRLRHRGSGRGDGWSGLASGQPWNAGF